MADISFLNLRYFLSSPNFTVTRFFLLVCLLLASGCAEIVKPPIHSPYTYSIIIKGVAPKDVQGFVSNLRVVDAVGEVDVIELTDNYAEYKITSQHDSSTMYNVITTTLDKQSWPYKVSYSAKKFLIVRG